MNKKIKAGIIGSTGYAGGELARLLLQRDDVEIVWYGSKSYADQKYGSIYQNMYQMTDAVCGNEDMEALADMADVVFTATPQGLCASLVSESVLSRTKIIDLSADFRIKDVEVYQAWYKIQHPSADFIKEAVYGLPELNRESIKQARLVANPGCYPTCSILTVYPLVKEGLIDPDTLIIDAKSGVSGAGRGAKVDNLYCEVNESCKAYGVASHRHTPEIEQELSRVAGEKIAVSFNPHLLPVNRGILATIYTRLKKPLTQDEVQSVYEQTWAGAPWVRVLPAGQLPETRSVRGTMFCDMAVTVDGRTGRLIITSAIDNLCRGASGQAVANANLMCGLPVSEGLEFAPLVP